MLLGSLVAAAAFAGSAEWVLDYDAIGLVSAGPEHKAIGPDRIAGGPTGLLAVDNPATGQLLVFEDQLLRSTIAAGPVDDVVFTPDGRLLVLAADRRVRVFSADGALLQTFVLPELVPTDVHLRVERDRVLGTDVFENRHAVALLTPGGLEPAAGPSLASPAHTVKRVPGGVSVDGRTLELSAIKASARVLDGGGTAWIVVEGVVGDHPIRVERWAIHDDLRVDLSPQARLYAPTSDISVDGEGRLLVLEPRADGLHILRVSP